MSATVCSSLDEMALLRKELHHERVAFVPTMGALHEGHLSLVHLAKQHADYVVMSIFVNPTQFGPSEDFQKYPRHLEEDITKGTAAGVDCFFTPTTDMMYPEGFGSYVLPDEQLNQQLEGPSRPGHFQGVCTIVSKLFNLIRPQIAVFGQKDYQQLLILQKMVKDLNIPVYLMPAPIHREADGLAMSSRNQYLQEEEREVSTQLHAALQYAKKQIIEHQATDLQTLKEDLSASFLTHPLIQIDYLEFAHPQTLQPQTQFEQQTQLLIAAWVGKTRLIDNCHISTMTSIL